MDYLSNNNKEIEVLEESVSVLLTNDLLDYYQIFPKDIRSSSIVFYASEQFAPELHIELECLLGLPVELCFFEEAKIKQLIHRKTLADSIKSSY